MRRGLPHGGPLRNVLFHCQFLQGRALRASLIADISPDRLFPSMQQMEQLGQVNSVGGGGAQGLADTDFHNFQRALIQEKHSALPALPVTVGSQVNEDKDRSKQLWFSKFLEDPLQMKTKFLPNWDSRRSQEEANPLCVPVSGCVICVGR